MLVYINNRDWYTSTRLMVERLHQCGAVPIIIDNDSAYEPLLEWYDTGAVEVVRLGRNGGPRAPWDDRGDVSRGEYYAVTDSDLDLAGVPDDFLDVLVAGLEQYPRAIKAGLSLEIDDLPEHYPWRESVLADEQRYWTERIDHRWFDAPIDTTLAVYRPGTGWSGYGPALRADRPYTARHRPWYIDPAALDDETRFYFNRASGAGTRWTAALLGKRAQEQAS